MEDFAPILWVLLTVAVMVASGISKARKQAEKAAKQAREHQDDEVWPQADETPSVPAAPATSFPSTTSPVSESYTGEAQSLEEIPADVFRPEIAPEPFGTTPVHRCKAHTTLRTAEKPPIEDEINAGSISDETPAHAKTPGEEFDLRKAVIYSEILKPKFEE